MAVRKIILDTETTGLDPYSGHRIVEIGALEMVGTTITDNKFHYYINPERDMPEEAYRVHGISSEFLQDKPLFKDIAKDFLEYIADSPLVIHNAKFDMKFLNYELSLLNTPSIESTRAVDTLIMARKKFPGARANLDALCRRFKIDNSDRQFHGALKDAKLLAEVYVELTGGRQVSFSIDQKTEEKKEIRLTDHDSDNKEYIVINPDEDELKLHNKLMERLQNNSWK